MKTLICFILLLPTLSIAQPENKTLFCSGTLKEKGKPDSAELPVSLRVINLNHFSSLPSVLVQTTEREGTFSDTLIGDSPVLANHKTFSNFSDDIMIHQRVVSFDLKSDLRSGVLYLRRLEDELNPEDPKRNIVRYQTNVNCSFE